MSNQLATTQQMSIIEQVMILGDLSKLTPEQRVQYYMETCKSLGLNPMTRPFDYINLSGKLTLYAKKDTTEQLRKIHGVSIDKPELQFADDLLIVTVTGQDKNGRRDTDLGVVTVGSLKGDAKANAVMKAITKAKRRLTLSICGLGWMDETEIETVPDARPVTVTDNGEVIDVPVSREQAAGNGHGNGGQANVLTLEEAKALRTPKGTPIGELPSDKLEWLIASPESSATYRAAATLVLNDRKDNQPA